MTIGIDIRILGSARRSGIVEYAEQLISRMIAAAPEHRFKLFYASARRTVPRSSWMKAPNVDLYAFPIPNNLLFALNRIIDWPKIDHLIGGVDVFFSPHLFIVSLSEQCRRVTTFHDLSYLRFPEFFTARKRLWNTIEMDPARQARFSNQIIAVSESTKTDLVEYYQIDPANITVIHSATRISRPIDEVLLELKKTHNLPRQFIL